MSEHLAQASHPGEIAVGEHRAPASYKLKATKEDNGAIRVALSLTAPRDWLLKHGFRHEATVLRPNGETVPVYLEQSLDVADNVAVTLHADDVICKSTEELHRTFPELED